MRYSLGLLALSFALSAPLPAGAQSCPPNRACFYVPPAYPTPPGYSVGWDMVLASPRGTITGTWRDATGNPTAFSVTAGTPLVITLSAALGTAGAYDTVEARGLFIEASSAELIVDHRLIVGPWQSSSTVKAATAALGTRFRLGSYNLNGVQSTDTGFDAASVYAPFGATVTFEAPSGAPLPFWQASADASFSVTLAPSESYVARTVPGQVCDRELMGALVTASAPIAVESGGRGWGLACTVAVNCGDDGVDNLLPVGALGTQYVVHDLPSAANAGEDLAVVADQSGTEVRLNGTLVATLGAGGVHRAAISGLTYVETSTPAYVFQNSGLTSCEIDLAMIPPVVLASLGGWITDFNVVGSGRVAVVIETANLASLRLNGNIPSFVSNEAVPGRPDLTAVQFSVGAGNHSVSAAGDFQLGLVTAAGGTGLFGYYTPYRVPGCGDGALGEGEGCDDGDVDDGDGCSSNCLLEIGATGCTSDATCVPAARCDGGTCVARCLAAEDCVDDNPCTTDLCDGATGACRFDAIDAGLTGGCTEPLVCSGPPQNACVTCASDLQCAEPTPRCELTSGTCFECVADGDCDDRDPCTNDTCSLGTCGHTPAEVGAPCPDGVCAPDGQCVPCLEGSCPDAGSPPEDASTSRDAGAAVDAGVARDAGLRPDATVAVDAAAEPTEESEGCDCRASGAPEGRQGFVALAFALAALLLRRRRR